MTLKPRRSAASKVYFCTVSLAFSAPALLAAPPPPPVAEPTLKHTGVRGDTLIGLGNRLLLPGTLWTVIQRLNRVPDPHRLQPGSQLRLLLAVMSEQAAQAVGVRRARRPRGGPAAVHDPRQATRAARALQSGVPRAPHP